MSSSGFPNKEGMDILDRVQCICHIKDSERAGTVQYGKEKAQGGNLINVYKNLVGLSKPDRATHISVISSDLARQLAQTEIQEIPCKYKINTFILMGLNIGMVCQARLWSHQPWRYLKPT